VLVDVFHHLHARVRPLSVTVEVFNAAMVARAASEGGRLPQTTEEYQRWVEESGCWWLTCGANGEPEPGRWPGHVVVVAWKAVLIDLTLPQASRPQRGIVLPPVAVRVWPEVLTGDDPRVLNVNGCELLYQARTEDRSFMCGPDWCRREPHREVVRAILRRVRDAMSRG
jgi:hypothetical protein